MASSAQTLCTETLERPSLEVYYASPVYHRRRSRETGEWNTCGDYQLWWQTAAQVRTFPMKVHINTNHLGTLGSSD